jgi:hypothetical protein
VPASPNLTARYSHRRLYDLAGAVDKLPSFLPGGKTEAAPLAATGTEGLLPPAEVAGLRSACASGDTGRGRLRVVDAEGGTGPESTIGPNPLTPPGAEGDCERVRVIDGKGGLLDEFRTAIRRPLPLNEVAALLAAG